MSQAIRECREQSDYPLCTLLFVWMQHRTRVGIADLIAWLVSFDKQQRDPHNPKLFHLQLFCGYALALPTNELCTMYLFYFFSILRELHEREKENQ